VHTIPKYSAETSFPLSEVERESSLMNDSLWKMKLDSNEEFPSFPKSTSNSNWMEEKKAHFSSSSSSQTKKKEKRLLL
jgi:hypothetical protein